MKIWLVGKIIEGGWMAEGAFFEESQAVAAAGEGEFVVRATVGERFPEKAEEAEVLYFPEEGGWEESVLYRKRNGEAG